MVAQPRSAATATAPVSAPQTSAPTTEPAASPARALTPPADVTTAAGRARVARDQRASERAACAAALPEVLTDPTQPTLVFQPIVDLSGGAVAGYEALARFSGPVDATPDVWFAAAAASGLGPALESRVVRAALRARQDLPVNCFLTVNVTPRALISAPVMDEFLRGGELTGLLIELTEEQEISDVADMREHLARLRDRGAMIALDDAGSGYSGLQRLVALRPDLVKLDRSLVGGIDKDEAKRACVEMFTVLAARLDSWLLAEGVETAAELRELIALEVPLGQGYLLGKPAPQWATLDAQTTAQIRVCARDSLDRVHLSSLSERVVLVPAGAPLPATPVECPEGTAIAVLLDADGRAGALAVYDEDTGRFRELPVTLRLNANTPISEAAALCMQRTGPSRFDPVLCTHDDGTVAGVVRLERVFSWLAR